MQGRPRPNVRTRQETTGAQMNLKGSFRLNMQEKLVMAPLLGVTGALFRTLFQTHFGGFDYAVSPFASAVAAKKVPRRHLRDMLPEKNRVLALVPQLLTNNPDDFLRMTAILFNEMGYSAINLNMGCPFPAVTRKKRGAGMIPHRDLIARFLDRVFSAAPCPVSIKTRLGYESPDELEELLDTFNAYPLHELIVHPRTALQLYSGQTDLARFRRILRASVNPTAYNGDICSYDQFAQLKEMFPRVSSWMIGRGALQNPFLPVEIREGGVSQKREQRRIRRFHDELYHGYRRAMQSAGPALGAMKELWRYLIKWFPPAAGPNLKRILKARSCEEFEDSVEPLFTSPS
jgi:tRNA-dihydrouridine synthase B